MDNLIPLFDLCFMDYNENQSLAVAIDTDTISYYGLAYSIPHPLWNAGSSMRMYCHYTLFVSCLETYCKFQRTLA